MTKDNKKTVITLVICIISLLLIIGGSYASWYYKYIGENTAIKIVDAEIEYLESDNKIINIENAFPMTDKKGKSQEETFDFEIKTKSNGNLDIGYSLILEKQGVALCSDIENPNQEEYPICYEPVLSDEVKEYTIEMIKSGFGVDTETAMAFYDATLAHDSSEMKEIMLEAGLPEGETSEIVMIFSIYGYEEYFLVIYQEETGNSASVDYEFNGNKTLGKLCSSLDNPAQESNPECYDLKDKNKLINYLMEDDMPILLATQFYEAVYSHDNKKIIEFYTNLGMSEEEAKSYAIMIGDGGYEEVIISDYESTTGETFDRTIEFYGSNIADVDFLEDNQVKVYIEDYEGNVILEPTKVSEILDNDYILYEKINEHNSEDKEIKNKYKLRVWVNQNVDASDWNEKTDFNYDFKINVRTKNMKEVTVTTTNASVNGENQKLIPENGVVSFEIIPEENTTLPKVSCTNNQKATLENNILTIENITKDTTCNVAYKKKPTIEVVVKNGVLDDEPSKIVEFYSTTTFNLIPNEQNVIALTKCDNGQTGTVNDNILTVSNISKSTTCIVEFVTSITTLYEDGTLIINEKLVDREANNKEHGSVSNEYEPLSSTQSYTFYSDDSILWYYERNEIKSVEVGEIIKPISTNNWFYQAENIESGNFINLDTSNTKSMMQMFFRAGYNATTFNLYGLENWDTTQVTDVTGLFLNSGYNATEWSIGDLSNWKTSNFKNMSNMFWNAGYKANKFDITYIENWDTANATDMKYMFYNAGYNATEWNIGDLSSWITTNVTDMSSMFDSAGYSAEIFDISYIENWNVSNVTNMYQMFRSAGYNATEWSVGDLSNWDTSKATNVNNMFSYAGYNASSLNLDLSNWDTSNITSTRNMFYNTGYNAKTISLNVSGWNTLKVTDTHQMFYDFGKQTEKLNITGISNWNVSNVTDMSLMFQNTGYKATEWSIGDLSDWNVSNVTNMSYAFYSAGHDATEWDIGNLKGWDMSNVTNASYMFANAGQNATKWSIGDLSNWNVSNVTNMGFMFFDAGYNATEWSIGDLSSWNTSNTEDMGGLFWGAGYKATIWNIGDLSNWNTSKVTSMGCMFEYAGYNAETFAIGNLSNWNTSKVTNMNAMFLNAGKNATEWSIGDLSNWDVSNVTTLSFMFYGAAQRTKTFDIGDLSNWNTSRVTDMSFMFWCTGLNAKIFNIGDLSKWDTSQVTDMDRMFYIAGQLATYTLDLSKWNVTNVKSYEAFNEGAESKVIPPVWVN